jgi:myo-inositol-1(or 4)-monophosphatase
MVTHGVRRVGAAALDLAYVASGRLDAFWEFGLNPWDMAAGMLLIEEAGGRCSDMHGNPAKLRGPHLLADNAAVHDEMLTVFREVFDGHYRYPMPAIK